MLTQSEHAQLFAARLVQALGNAKLTVSDIGIPPIYLYGEILPPINELTEIAKKLGITAEWLSGLDVEGVEKEM